jgi:D-tyrosyl-tRNA(Tyr) deacylase
MRMLLQRVREARVRVKGELVGEIGRGLLLFLAIGKEDNEQKVTEGIRKVINLRIFENEQGKFDRSLLQVGGEVLVVSQFTLYGDCSKGRRPSFERAASPQRAKDLYDLFVARLGETGIRCSSGIFGERMEVELINDGPVTLWLEV